MSANATHEPTFQGRVLWGVTLVVLVLLSLGFPYFEATRNANERPRLIQGMAMVDEGRLDLGGKSRRGLDPGPDISRNAEGVLYPNKPPTTSAVAAVAYLATRVSAAVEPRVPTLRDYTWWARFLGGILPTCLLCWIAMRRQLARDGLWPAMAAAVVYVLATPAVVYGHLFYGHQLAALLLYVGLDVLAEAHEHGSYDKAFGGGLAAGAAVAVEYGAVFAGPAVAVMLVLGLRRPGGARVAMWALAGALLPVAGLAAYHWHAFGAPWRTGYHFVVNPDFADKHGQGLLGLSWPTLQGARVHLISPGGGLLWWAPVVAVGVWGLIELARDRQCTHRWVGILNLSVLLSMIVVGTGLVFDGGWRVGPRYLVCVLPCIIPGLSHLLSRRGDRAWVLGLFGVCVGYGVVVNGLAANLWPHLDLTNVHSPVAEVLLPLLRSGYEPYGPLHAAGIGHAVWIVTVASLVLVAGLTLQAGRGLERKEAWAGVLGVVVGAALVGVVPSLVAPHPRGPANLAYIQRIYEPGLDGAEQASFVLEPLDELPPIRRRRGHAGRRR